MEVEAKCKSKKQASIVEKQEQKSKKRREEMHGHDVQDRNCIELQVDLLTLSLYEGIEVRKVQEGFGLYILHECVFETGKG